MLLWLWILLIQRRLSRHHPDIKPGSDSHRRWSACLLGLVFQVACLTLDTTRQCLFAFTGCLYLKGLPVVMHNFTRVFIIIVVTPYLGICKPLCRQRSLVFSIILLTIRPMTPFLDEWATFISVHLLLCPRAQNTLVTPLLADVNF